MKNISNFIVRITKIVLSITNIILIVIIVLNILLLISEKVLKNEYPTILDYTYLSLKWVLQILMLIKEIYY